MIAYIKGELVETLPGSVILDVHGIGYRIYISGRESEQLTKMGSQVKLHTYFHVKEDAMQLYGFQHKDDLEVFFTAAWCQRDRTEGGTWDPDCIFSR